MSVKKYLSPREVYEEFNIPMNTLRRWRCEGRGPDAIKLGVKDNNKRSGTIRYDRSEIEALFNKGAKYV